VSAGVVAGLVWIGFASHRPRTTPSFPALVERIPMPRHPAPRTTSRMASSAAPNAVIIGDNGGWRDIGRCDRPLASRRGALQQSMTRYPNITPGEELTGYS
jgi:hypothetical protein